MDILPTYMLFVGANNVTLRVERRLLECVLADNHAGYTILDAQGSWSRKSEETAVVIVSDTPDSVVRTVKQLKKVLRQDAIAVVALPPMQFL